MRLHVFIYYKDGKTKVSEKGTEIKPQHTNEGIIEVFTDRLKKDDAIEVRLQKNICTVLRLVKGEDGSVTVERDLLDWARKGER